MAAPPETRETALEAVKRDLFGDSEEAQTLGKRQREPETETERRKRRALEVKALQRKGDEQRVHSAKKIFPELKVGEFPCHHFLRRIYQLATHMTHGGSALDITVVRKTIRATRPGHVTPLTPTDRWHFFDLLRHANLKTWFTGTPKDRTSCRILHFRMELLEKAKVPINPQIFAFVVASTLGSTKKHDQANIFSSFLSHDHNAAFQVLCAEWNLNTGGRLAGFWSQCPITRPSNKQRTCLAAAFNWYQVMTNAAARGDIKRMREIGEVATRLANFGKYADPGCDLAALLVNAGKRAPNLTNEQHNKLCNDIIDFQTEKLKDFAARKLLRASLEHIQNTRGAPCVSSLAALKARIAKLPQLRMPKQLHVERQLDLFGGAVSGDCPICFDPVHRTNYYLYPCQCKTVFHSTCMARCVDTGSKKIMYCPTCRAAAVSVPPV
jgi:hypothetical protein